MTSIARPGAIGAPVTVPSVARLAAILRGTDAAWVRPAQLGVTLLAAILYVANLAVSGFANGYYSAAALAASQSWTAWFFGSIDAANFITVDKPPLATMLMGLSVRIFGLSSWSILLPEALCGIATVAILFAVVRRTSGPVAATIAGVVMAVMPVAVLIFRYNNPDALLTLLLVSGAWALVRGLEHGRIRWAVLSAVFVGLAFNTKLLQAYLVLPAFAFVWAVAAPGGIRKRIAGLAASVVAVIASSAWWVLAVELIPANARPFIGGSTTNSALELVLGYDGLGRIFGMTGGGGRGGGFSGTPGILRLFNAEFGGQIAWLLPFALVALVAGLVLRGRAPRTDIPRAGYLLWGLWLIGTGLVFSFMSGVIHSYYAVVLVPAIAALVGAGMVDMWALRSRSRLGGIPLAAAILGSAAVAWALLERTPDFVPGLGVAVLAIGAIAALLIAIPVEVGGRVRLAAVSIALVALLAGPMAYSMDTIASAHSGGDASAGPQVASTDGGPGGMGGGPGSAGGGPDGQFAAVGAPPSSAAGGTPPTDTGTVGQAPSGGTAGGGMGGGADATLTSYLMANRGTATWIVAVSSANSAAPIELATGAPVMAMGGFTGSDPAPTLAELQSYVASGQLRYVIVGGDGGNGGAPGVATTTSTGTGSDGTASTRNAWVTSTCTLVDYGGSGTSTLYDCAGAIATGG